MPATTATPTTTTAPPTTALRTDELEATLHALTTQAETELHAATEKLADLRDTIGTTDLDNAEAWTAILDARSWLTSAHGTVDATYALIRAHKRT